MKTATIHRESNQLIPRNSFLGRKGSPLPPWKPHRLCLFSLSAPTDTYTHMAGNTHMAGEQLSCHSNAPSSTHRHASGPWREAGPILHPRQAHGGKRALGPTLVFRKLQDTSTNVCFKDARGRTQILLPLPPCFTPAAPYF